MLRLKYEGSCNYRLSLFSPRVEDILKTLEETIEPIHVPLTEISCFENLPCFERLKFLTIQKAEMLQCERSKMMTKGPSDEVVSL